MKNATVIDLQMGVTILFRPSLDLIALALQSIQSSQKLKLNTCPSGMYFYKLHLLE
jgi:hypothetical protein